MKSFICLFSLPLLFACTESTIEFKHTDLANDTFYAKKTGKPFTGKITNIPYEVFAKQDFLQSFYAYNVFLMNPMMVDLATNYQRHQQLRPLLCDITVKKGILNGKTDCNYNSPYNTGKMTVGSTEIAFQANYKDGSITDNHLYRLLDDKKIKVMSTLFNNAIGDDFDMKIFSVNQPEVMLMHIQETPEKSIMSINTHQGNLLSYTELSDTESHIDQYDPNTNEKLGTISFNGRLAYASDQLDGYHFEYEMYPDNPNIRIKEANFYKNHAKVSSKYYSVDSNESFNLAEFNQQIIDSEKSRERFLNSLKNHNEPDYRSFSEIILENQREDSTSDSW